MIHWIIKHPLASVIIFGILFRSSVSAVLFSGFQDDTDAYRLLAQTWAVTGVYGHAQIDSPDRDPSYGAATPKADSNFSGNISNVSPTAFRPPLYPWILSWFVINGELPSISVAILHIALAVVSIAALFQISEKIITEFSGCSRRVAGRWAALASLLFLADPILLRHQSLIMTETLATAFAVVTWWMWIFWLSEHDGRRASLIQYLQYLAFGIWLAISIYCRPTSAVWSLLLAAGVVIRPPCRNASAGSVGQVTDIGPLDARHNTMSSKPILKLYRRLTLSCIVIIGIGAGLAPWIIRNHIQLGKPVWATTHGGYTLLLANNPMLYQHFQREGWGRDWDAEPFHQRWSERWQGDATSERFWTTKEMPQSSDGDRSSFSPLSPSFAERSIDFSHASGTRKHREIIEDEYAYRAARATISRNREMASLSCLIRLGWLWAIFPGPDLPANSRIIVAVWYGLLYLLAIVGIWRCRAVLLASHFWPALTLVASLCVVHSIYWSNMRMRAPAMPVIAILAAVGCSVLLAYSVGNSRREERAT